MLTKRQSEVLRYIQSGVLKNGYPPTLREIASFFKIQSVRTVFDHIVALEKKGYIKRDKGKRRGLRILRNIQLPVIGEISAGSPMAPLNIEDYIELDKFLNAEHLFLKVKGASMVEDGIRDKDIVVVKPQKVVRDGDIIACVIDGEVLVKRFKRNNGEVMLLPANKDMEPLIIKEKDGKRLEVIGKVVALLRSYE
ncbi:MAG: transcriptional repressor LexA [Proteobacteria bacterium]|nr:transcriptional repressor LexA [Pseudomonadota bacterium]